MSDRKINPWFGIFFSPRKVAQEVVIPTPKYRFAFISIIYGFMAFLELLQNSSVGVYYSIWVILAVACLLSFPAGYVALSVSALLLVWTGKILGGQGSFLSVRSALAWSKVPEMVALVGWGVLMSVYRAQLFTPAFAEKVYHSGYWTLPSVILLFQLGFGVWGFIALLHTLAEVQLFSLWRSLVNIVFKVAVFVIIVTMLNWMFMAFIYMGSSVPKGLQEILKI